MKVNLTSIRLNIPDDAALAVIKADEPLKSYRHMLETAYSIDGKSVSEYDVENLRRSVAMHLGEKALVEMGLTAAADKEMP